MAAHCVKGNNGRVSRKSSDSESHISRLGYCFVSSQFQSCRDSSLCAEVGALQRAKSLGALQLVFVLNFSKSVQFLPGTFNSPWWSVRRRQAEWPCVYDGSVDAVRIWRTAGVIRSGKAVLVVLLLIGVQLCCAHLQYYLSHWFVLWLCWPRTSRRGFHVTFIATSLMGVIRQKPRK